MTSAALSGNGALKGLIRYSVLPWVLPVMLGTSTPTVFASITGAGQLSAKVEPKIKAALSGHGALTIPATPLANVLNKLGGNQSTAIQILGDSTAWGEFDTFQTTMFGWAGRLALMLGIYYNTNVVVNCWYPNYPGGPVAYGSPVTIHTSSLGGSAPTLTVWLGGWPGGVLSDYLTYAGTIMPTTSIDAVIIQDGFNETSFTALSEQPPTYETQYVQLVSEIQSTYCPGAPIILTTANLTTIADEPAHGILFTFIWDAMLTTFLPAQTVPMTPILAPSSNTNGVWLIDTRQANQTAAELYSDGLHPNTAGYQMQAHLMLSQMAPNVADNVFPSTVNQVSVSGRGVLTVVAVGPAIPQLAGHGALSATRSVTTARYFGGHGTLSAASQNVRPDQLPYVLPFILGTIYYPSPSGHGALSAATSARSAAAAHPSGQGALSAKTKPGVAAHPPGHGALTGFIGFSIAPHPPGHGALSAKTTTKTPAHLASHGALTGTTTGRHNALHGHGALAGVITQSKPPHRRTDIAPSNGRTMNTTTTPTTDTVPTNRRTINIPPTSRTG